MRSWWKEAGAAFAGSVAALGLLVVMIAVFLPRELDRLAADIKSNQDAIEILTATVNTSIEGQKQALLVIEDNLVRVVASARATAKVQTEQRAMIAFNAAEGDFERAVLYQILSENLPREVFVRWNNAGKTNSLLASKLEGEVFLFVDRRRLNDFTVEDRRFLDAMDDLPLTNVLYWEAAAFPGYFPPERNP